MQHLSRCRYHKMLHLHVVKRQHLFGRSNSINHAWTMFTFGWYFFMEHIYTKPHFISAHKSILQTDWFAHEHCNKLHSSIETATWNASGRKNTLNRENEVIDSWKKIIATARSRTHVRTFVAFFYVSYWMQWLMNISNLNRFRLVLFHDSFAIVFASSFSQWNRGSTNGEYLKINLIFVIAADILFDLRWFCLYNANRRRWTFRFYMHIKSTSTM